MTAIYPDEAEAARPVERLLTGRDSLTVCAGLQDRRAAAAHQRAAAGDGRQVGNLHLREQDDPSTSALVERLAGPKGAGPIEVRDIGRWPGGAGDFAQRLNGAREHLREECPRPVLVWASDAEATSFAKADARMGTWHSGMFDFSKTRDEAPAHGRGSKRLHAEPQIGRVAPEPATPPESAAGSAARSESRDLGRGSGRA